jgi:hypothetical protein
VGGVAAERLQLRRLVQVPVASDAEDAVGEFEAEVLGAAGEPVDQGRREELGRPVLACALEGVGVRVLQPLIVAEVELAHLLERPGDTAELAAPSRRSRGRA